MKKKIYIASQYTKGDQIENVNVQIDLYSELMDLGYLPYSPLLMHFIHERHPKSYDEWMDICYPWLEVCDYVLRIPGDSKGSDLEEQYANEKGIPVFYSIKEILDYDFD